MLGEFAFVAVAAVDAGSPVGCRVLKSRHSDAPELAARVHEALVVFLVVHVGVLERILMIFNRGRLRSRHELLGNLRLVLALRILLKLVDGAHDFLDSALRLAFWIGVVFRNDVESQSVLIDNSPVT